MAFDSNSASYINVYDQRGNGMLACFSEISQHQPSNSAWPELQHAAGTPGAAYCLNPTTTQISSTSAGQGYDKLQVLTAGSANTQQAQQGFGAGLISSWPAGTLPGPQPGSFLTTPDTFAPAIPAPAAPTELQQQLDEVMLQFEQPGPQQQLPAAGTPASAAAATAGGQACAGSLPPANSYSQLQLQLQLQSNAATDAGAAPQRQQQQRKDPSRQQQQPCVQLGEVQLLLPAVHAEYKAEMALMLRACQVATCAIKHSAATGTTLVLDPASRTQLQRQVLANCNDKHAAVTAAFKQAAEAIAAAAAAVGCSSGSGGAPQQQQEAPAAAAGSHLATQGSSAAAAAAAAAAAGSSCEPASAATADAMVYTWQCLDRLRNTYQQELVAATSALFAICRGFGQCYALSSTATAAIKAALAAAQQQHARVEQLWSDLVMAAGGA